MSTLGYLRTLYEIYVKSRFLDKFAQSDQDLPGKFSYYNNTTYLDYYKRFSGTGSTTALSDTSWSSADEYYGDRFPREGKGDYGWTYPNVLSENGKPKRRPTFRDLMNEVDGTSPFHSIYYEVSSSSVHGEFILGGTLGRPSASGAIDIDSFSTGGIDSILGVLIPMF